MMRTPKPLDTAIVNRIIAARERVAANFGEENWAEVGLLTQSTDLIEGHHRLLRSLSWGDEDYSGNVLVVLRQIVERNRQTLPIIERYLDEKYPGESHFISAKPAERKITFAPHVFHVPEEAYPELDLVAVMMPFDAAFSPVHEAIRQACEAHRLRCVRGDDIWEESVIMQDIFNLIFRAQVVVVDFTGKNANVMYETGIAHTLGKHVVPISQSLDDVPFDLRQHRVAKYLPNGEGLASLRMVLKEKLKQFAVPELPPASEPQQPVNLDDDIPF
jgi:hypothetical protein